MTTITLLTEPKSKYEYSIKGFEIKGHTKLVVCHGLSALSYFVAIGINDIAKRDDTHFRDTVGDTRFIIDGKLDDISEAIMLTFQRSLQEMNKYYPDTIEILYKNIEPV